MILAKITKLKLKKYLLALVFLSSSFVQLTFAADYPAKGDIQRGAKSWSENCGRCHNIRSANELRDDQWITTVFHMRVRAGLTGQETRDILTFLQASNTAIKRSVKRVVSDTSNLTGKIIYNQTCIACHAANGKGSFPGVPDLTEKNGRLAQKDEILLDHITNGFQSEGSSMAMPPKGGNQDLTAKNIKDTLLYLRKQFVD